MPPKFEKDSFKFEEGQEVPDRIEGYPRAKERDRTKLWVEGYDTFSHESYTLAVDIDDLPTADVLLQARLSHLEETQPTASSGGQSEYGIQDRVYIRHPEL